MKFRLLLPEEIECRIATINMNGQNQGITLLLYKDARVDQNILDEAVGLDRWQRKHELINGNLFCSVGIYCRHDDGTSEWVWKQDVGTESYTEKEKGQASDSFKRACFNWGIGRELYTAPFIWIPAQYCKIVERNGKYTCYDKFEVMDIGYTNEGRINYLVIGNSRSHEVVFAYPSKKK